MNIIIDGHLHWVGRLDLNISCSINRSLSLEQCLFTSSYQSGYLDSIPFVNIRIGHQHTTRPCKRKWVHHLAKKMGTLPCNKNGYIILQRKWVQHIAKKMGTLPCKENRYIQRYVCFCTIMSHSRYQESDVKPHLYHFVSLSAHQRHAIQVGRKWPAFKCLLRH